MSSINLKIFAVGLFFASAALLGYSILARGFGASCLMIGALAASTYFLLDMFNLFWPSLGPTINTIQFTQKDDPEFQAGEPLSADDLRRIASAQIQPPRVTFRELKAESRERSELEIFDEAMREHDHSERTLVVSQLHRKQVSPKSTLVGHFTGHVQLDSLVCHEISPNVDLIPYAGFLPSDLSSRARGFIDEQLGNYKRILFLLPMEQLEIWRGSISAQPLHTDSTSEPGELIPTH